MDMLAIPTDKAGNDRARPRSMEGTVTFNACGLLPVLPVLLVVVLLLVLVVVLLVVATVDVLVIALLPPPNNSTSTDFANFKSNSDIFAATLRDVSTPHDRIL